MAPPVDVTQAVTMAPSYSLAAGSLNNDGTAWLSVSFHVEGIPDYWYVPKGNGFFSIQ